MNRVLNIDRLELLKGERNKLNELENISELYEFILEALKSKNEDNEGELAFLKSLKIMLDINKSEIDKGDRDVNKHKNDLLFNYNQKIERLEKIISSDN